jgi:hypothetical protein
MTPTDTAHLARLVAAAHEVVRQARHANNLDVHTGALRGTTVFPGASSIRARQQATASAAVATALEVFLIQQRLPTDVAATVKATVLPN